MESIKTDTLKDALEKLTRKVLDRHSPLVDIGILWVLVSTATTTNMTAPTLLGVMEILECELEGVKNVTTELKELREAILSIIGDMKNGTIVTSLQVAEAILITRYKREEYLKVKGKWNQYT